MKSVPRKVAIKAHKKCCPYKGSAVGKCGANKPLDDKGKCDGDCWYMKTFKQHIEDLSEQEP